MWMVWEPLRKFQQNRSCPNWSLKEKKESIYTAGLRCLAVTPTYSPRRSSGFRKGEVCGGSWIGLHEDMPVQLNCQDCVKALVRAGFLGFDPTRQLTSADASKVECRLPAEIHFQQESPPLPLLTTLRMTRVRSRQAAETCLSATPVTLEDFETYLRRAISKRQNI